MVQFVKNDGGRAEAGFKGEAPGDCVARAIAIATELPYREVYDMLNDVAPVVQRNRKRRGKVYQSAARTGIEKTATRRVMERLGWRWVPTMQIGSGCKVHVRADELPKGRIIVKLSAHVAAVIDGVLHDTYDCSREGTRCVYGYWEKNV